MPGDEAVCLAAFQRIEQRARVRRVRRASQRDIDEDVSVDQQRHRYFFAKRRYRSPRRRAGRNRPSHRVANVGVSDALSSRRACSIRRDSETPRWRAYRLASGTSVSSTVMVSLAFIPATPYTYEF
jgi:hypothetical protein